MKTRPSARSAESPIRTVVVDDVATLRKCIIDHLVGAGHFEIVGEAVHGAEAVELARRHNPDLVLIDIHMPVMNGIEATRLIKKLPSPPRVIAVSLADDHTVQAVLDAGADAFCDKQDLFTALIDRILGFFPSGGRTRKGGA